MAVAWAILAVATLGANATAGRVIFILWTVTVAVGIPWSRWLRSRTSWRISSSPANRRSWIKDWLNADSLNKDRNDSGR
jgi:hypothetical protein